MEEKVIKEIDDTIVKIAQDIREGAYPPGIYGGVVSSLADLVLARAMIPEPNRKRDIGKNPTC